MNQVQGAAEVVVPVGNKEEKEVDNVLETCQLALVVVLRAPYRITNLMHVLYIDTLCIGEI